MPVTYEPIGIIHTPFSNKENMPIQPGGAAGIKGFIDIRKELEAGLADLDGFSHIILVYHFHKSSGFDLKVVPYLDDQPHGIFATRAPRRPNQIGLSTVRLLAVRRNILIIENVDMIDGTPLLDIKPYIPAFDVHETEKTGWADGKSTAHKNTRSDGRFS